MKVEIGGRECRVADVLVRVPAAPWGGGPWVVMTREGRQLDPAETLDLTAEPVMIKLIEGAERIVGTAPRVFFSEHQGGPAVRRRAAAPKAQAADARLFEEAGKKAATPGAAAARRPAATPPPTSEENEDELDYVGPSRGTGVAAPPPPPLRSPLSSVDDDDEGAARARGGSVESTDSEAEYAAAYEREAADRARAASNANTIRNKKKKPPPAGAADDDSSGLLKARVGQMRALGTKLFSKGLDVAKVAVSKVAIKVDEVILDVAAQSSLSSSSSSSRHHHKTVQVGDRKLWLGRLADKEANRESYVARDLDDANVEFDLCMIRCPSALEVADVKREVAICRRLAEVRGIQPLLAQSVLRHDEERTPVITVLLLRPLYVHTVQETLTDYARAWSAAALEQRQQQQQQDGAAPLENPWKEHRAARLLVGTALALRHLHERNVAHLDLSPRSVALTDQRAEPVLCRFRHAREVPLDLDTADRLGDFQRTAIFASDHAAPELRDVALGTVIDSAADVFAFGCTMYNVAFGQPPPDPLTFPRNHDHGNVRFSQAYVDIVRAALHPDPKQRPMMSDLLPKLRAL